ncbi:hypothetical protein M8J75_014942 [Diaphorina citri]|nr:hypothetical protein M8J75_014942 [Diaphorina citri]
MLQFSIAAACCTIFLISSVAADATEDTRWSRQASSERERRIDDWVPVTDPCPTCKRPLIGEQKPGQSDDISSLLTPPNFGKPRNLPLSSQDAFFTSPLPKGQNSIQFPNNRPFSLRQANGPPNFLQSGQPNPFIQEQKSQQFFSGPPAQTHQSFSFQQPPFFIPPQQSHFPIPNQPRPQFNFIQPPSASGRPQTLPPQFNNRIPPKVNTFPGVVTPVPIGTLQNEKEEVQLLYVPVETLQKNKLKDSRPFGKQSSEKGPTFQLSPTSQSIIKDQRFPIPAEQLNQREPKQNFNGIPPQFSNPSSFQFQQIGDTKFSSGFEQNFRHPGFQTFTPPQNQPPPPPSFIRNENQNRFEFAQQSAVPSNEIRQTTPTFNQFASSQTPAPTFTNQVQYTPIPVPTLPQNPPPHQPPLAVYMERNENSKVTDVLSILKEAKTIPVLDQVEEQSPIVFVGPSSLDPPKGYVKFDLPYLSSLESNRIERKIANLPFFVAPLNFKPPPGYSKVPFPAPHIGSVVISNSTIFKEALEKPSTKVPFSSFDLSTQKAFSDNTQVTLSSSPNFYQETKSNEISSTTPLPSTFKQFTTAPSFETNPPTFETSRPQFEFQEQQFTRKPTINSLPPFEEVQNVQFTQPPADIKPQFVEKQPEFNVNQPQGVKQEEFRVGQQQFSEQSFDAKQQFNVQPQFNPPQTPLKPQFTAGTPQFEVQQPQFNSVSSQFDIKQGEITAPPPSVPQFEGQQITYQFEKDQFKANNQREQEFANQRQPEFANQRQPEFTNQRQPEFTNQRQPEFTNQRQPEFTNQRQPEFTNQRQPEFTNLRQPDFTTQREQEFTTQPQAPQLVPENTFEVNQPQFNNQPQDQIYNQQNSFEPPQTSDFANQPNVQQNNENVISQQAQYDLTTEAPAQVESTTVYIPRRKTTTPKQQYKSSTPPPNYNPRRNRKPLYRGLPKNSGEIQATTQATFVSDYNEPQKPVYNSERPQSNHIGTRFEETFTPKNENYPTEKPKEYQTASETYYQPEIVDNTVVPLFEQKPTENYPKTENIETTPTFTQQTPNYSNFQGINQFFNQVIQKETYIPQERTTVSTETPTTLPARVEQSFYTAQQNTIETSQSPIYTQTTPQTEATPQQSVSSNDQEYTKKPNFSEKRHKYRQKLQNTGNSYENTPVHDNGEKTDAVETEKPLRNKNKYRNRQRLGNRGQYRTSTSTEAVDENIPAHFSSITNQNAYNQVTENSEIQSTSTEHASTKIDVGKYGTFKRRRPIKAYERASTSTESSNVDVETTPQYVSSTRSYRPRARTTSAPGERVTRHRARRPSTSTTPETTSVSDHTEPPPRVEENTSVDWGSYVSSFNPSAQGNDVLGSLEDQNKISKTEENAIDQFSIQKSQSYEITSPTSNIDFSQNSAVTSSDQASYSTNDQGSVSQFETRKFSSKKLHSGFAESDNTHQDTPVSINYDSQLDTINSRNTGFRTEETNLEASNVDDKSILDKSTEGKKAYDPATGKKVGARRRGQWVRVRVKKPNQEYFETAESQNVANLGNSVQNPTKPSVIRLSSEEFSRLQNKGHFEPEGSVSDHVYFTSTTERVTTTTTEDSPSRFDLEKGVSAMIAEFMNVDEDESKDNAQEIFENVEAKPSEQPVIPKEETSIENQQVSGSYGIDNTENLRTTTVASSQNESVQSNGDSSINSPNEQNKDEVYTQEYVNENISNGANIEQTVEQQNKNAGYDNTNHFSPVPSEISAGAFQTQYHENYNEESEQKESQLKEREIKHNAEENLNYEFSNHKYDDKGYVVESEGHEDVQGEKQVEQKEEINTTTTPLPVVNVENKVQEIPKENVSTEAPEITTSSPDSEVPTEEYDVAITTELPSGTTHSKVLGTSTTTEISLETEICYKGRCVKSKKKRPAYQDLLPVN